jgi:tetratricopeptide (TPR) repeat protein
VNIPGLPPLPNQNELWWAARKDLEQAAELIDKPEVTPDPNGLLHELQFGVLRTLAGLVWQDAARKPEGDERTKAFERAEGLARRALTIETMIDVRSGAISQLIPPLLALGKLDEAEKQLDVLERLGWDESDLRSARGDLELRRGNFAKAIEHFTAATARPQHEEWRKRPDYWGGLALAKARAGDAAGAKAAYQEQLKAVGELNFPWLSKETVRAALEK